MLFSLEFDNPEMVSLYEIKDMIMIQFFNTHQFMVDSDGRSNNILPHGYKVITELPRQKSLNSGTGNISEEQAISSSQTIVTAAPLLSFFFNLSM